MQMAALPVVIPLAVAAMLAALGTFLPRRAADAIAIATSSAITAICVLLTIHSREEILVSWFGGWKPTPQSHFPVGISFMIDPIGAGLASLVALLFVAAFTFSWSYFESVKALYHVLMLVFLGAMCGLCLTGDLFNLFVWFELMTAAGVALCGYKSEESQPLQGALNFAVTNTVGAFLSLTGVALLYAFTGSLNMSEVGRTVAANSLDHRFLTVAFLFVIAGFLTKSAAFPFHFWLADAHAVAPTPVCILFSGVMVELGIYAIARIYWLVFGTSLEPAPEAIRTVFLAVGAVTAAVGALFCFGQRHLKRLLAFSTMSHVGLMLMGFGFLDPTSLAGTAIYIVGHGMIKGSLFVGAGILLHRFGTVDEYDMRGAGRQILPVGFMMIIGAWGLAGLPPFATFYGAKLMSSTAQALHLTWVSAVMAFVEVFTAAAVLRFTSRAFLGWGHGHSISTRGAPHIHMEVETQGEHKRVPAFMWVPMALLLVGAAAVAVPLQSRLGAERYASQFESAHIYQNAVLLGNVQAPPRSQGSEQDLPTWVEVVVALAIMGLAAVSLFPNSRQFRFARPFGNILKGILSLRLIQSGRIGDYIAWFAFGISVYGGMLLLIH